MTSKQKELHEQIWHIWQIEITAKDCFQYSYYLHKPSTEVEFEYLKNHPDFTFIRHILWRMTIIELSKLFSSSPTRDKFNINHLINKLKKDGHFGELGISHLKIEEWELTLRNNQKQIDTIITLRDKIYAHTDRKKEEFKLIQLSFEEIEVLLKTVSDIIREINIVVFEKDPDMSNLTFDKENFNIIKTLANEYKKGL
jgi:hypothetical protein